MDLIEYLTSYKKGKQIRKKKSEREEFLEEQEASDKGDLNIIVQKIKMLEII